MKTIYPYLVAIIETNYRRKIRLRYQVGAGVSYSVVAKANSLIRFSFTGTYEHTRFGGSTFEYVSDTLSNTIQQWRITGRLYGRQQLLQKKLRLLYECWWQQSVLNVKDMRLYNEESLEVHLSKMLSFRTGVRYTYESVRLKNLKAFDLFVTFGCTISIF